MCYVILSGCSITWFLLSLIADMLILTSIVTPKWLIGPLDNSQSIINTNGTLNKYPSFGIYTRCRVMRHIGYNCGAFDLDGFATDNEVYPPEWKASMFFISLGFALLSTTISMIFLSCCRQSIYGKSIHNLTGCIQVFAGICVMISTFLHPFGWSSKRVVRICGPDTEAFYPGECTLGVAFYCAIVGIMLCFFCAWISLKAETSNMRSKVRRRVEEGERLVCIP